MHLKIIMFAFLFLLHRYSIAEPWIRHQSPVNSMLVTLSYPDSIHAWAAGADGTIIYSSNAGINWMQQNSNVNFLIHKIFFINDITGWAVASGYQTANVILKTTNNGLNWLSSNFPDSNYFYSVYFQNELTGWMAGYNGRFVKSTNGGTTWFNVSADTNVYSGLPVNDINLYNSGYGFACGGFYDLAGIIWKTTDFGLNWFSTVVSTEPLNDIQYFDSSNIIISGGDFEIGVQIVKTSNAGLDWEYVALNMFGIGKGISFRTPQEGWIVLGFSPYFAFSSNGGLNWSNIPVMNEDELYDIHFYNNRYGIACGDSGVIYRYNTPPIGIKKLSGYVPSEFYLFQNFPNPFNPSTKIKFSVPDFNSEPVKLIIYDVLGREVSILVNEQLTPGNYEVTWNATGYSGGLYYYSLTSDQYQLTGKMILVK